MVYESDFSRRSFLNDCAQSGMFYSSPEYKPRSTLSTLRGSSTGTGSTWLPSTTSGSPIGISNREAARLIAKRHLEASSSKSPRLVRRYRDHEENETEDDEGERRSYSSYSQRISGRQKACSCCKNCGGSRQEYGNGPDLPLSALSLKSPQDMESYLKSRSSQMHEDLSSTKARPTYSVRNIPVRSLEELRETVAIRRNYLKDRQQVLNELFPKTNSEEPATSASISSPADADAEGSVCSDFPESITTEDVSTVQ